jgi:hypothetical protein
MGKYAGVVVGAIVALLGLAGILAWRHELVSIIKGTVPAMMVFGGVIAVIAGLSEIKDEAAAKKEDKK